MKEKGRGSMEIWTASIDNVKLRVVKWQGNRAVTLLSTYKAINQTTELLRWDWKERKKVTCPSIVSTYNKFMGGVDLLDSLLSLYRIESRSKKWYLKLLFHCFDMIVLQSWLLYRRDCCSTGKENKSCLVMRDFKMSIAHSLLRAGKASVSKRGKPSSLDAAIHAKKNKKGWLFQFPINP